VTASHALGSLHGGKPERESARGLPLLGQWERRVCLSFPCLLDQYHVRRLGGPGGLWLVADRPEGRPLLEVAAKPRCPQCGGELVLVPRPS